jgi:anaerobic C4-dicarboxylate transporter
MAAFGSIAAWLLALLETGVGKVLAALGVGWITYTATQSAIDQVKEQVQMAWGELPYNAAVLATMAGFDTAFGILLGAYVARATLAAMPKLGKLTSGS